MYGKRHRIWRCCFWPGLQVIDEGLYEAAKIDGQMYSRDFSKITLPIVKPSLLVALLFGTLACIPCIRPCKRIDRRVPMVQRVLPCMHASAMTFLNFGYGSALAILIFIIVFGISLIYMCFLKKDLTQSRGVFMSKKTNVQ
ncbi:MAG: hypothetical protein ACLR5B_03270 [Blautia sp.]